MSSLQSLKDLLGSYVKFEKTGERVPFYTHLIPHIDEVFIIDMLRWEGTKEFIDKYFRSGVVYIGCGGGELDDHIERANGKKNVSSIKLFAKALGIENDPKWKSIIDFAHQNDTRGRQDLMAIGNILKILHYQRQDMQEENISWALQGLWVKYHDQEKFAKNFTIDRIRKVAPSISGYKANIDPKKWYKVATTALKLDQVFFQQAIEEIELKKRLGVMLEKVVVYKGKKVKIVAIESDNYKMNPALRAPAGGVKADVPIIRSCGGRNFISAKPRNGVRLNEVTSTIRFEEQMKKLENGQIRRLVTTDWKDLQQDGDVGGAEEWHYFSEANMLFNGSYSHPYVPSSALSLMEIFRLVTLGIDQSVFCFPGCSQKKACVRHECRWYGWGLNRCWFKRRKEAKKTK